MVRLAVIRPEEFIEQRFHRSDEDARVMPVARLGLVRRSELQDVKAVLRYRWLKVEDIYAIR